MTCRLEEQVEKIMNKNENYWRKAILPATATLQEVIDNMNASSLRIVLIVNGAGQLEGTVSDGDIRRSLLKGITLNDSIEAVVHRSAFVVPPAMSREMVLQLMVANKIHQIPVVDENQHVLGLHLWDEISSLPERDNLIVIMAGGKGTRLRPFTENCPKPMVMVAGKPMLEHIIERAKLEGFSDFVVTLHYLGHMIEEYFGDGSRFGVSIEYLRERDPLGTAGALSLLKRSLENPFIVTNGDVVTDIRYGDLIDFHVRYDAAATMAVRSFEWQHPFGVVQTMGVDIVGFEEKPVARSHINAGIYVLSPRAMQEMEYGIACDMPMLFERLQSLSYRTVAYPMHEPWLDVGRPDDLLKAQRAFGGRMTE
jgi:dTDP-glucose pyrophosphorylase